MSRAICIVLILFGGMCVGRFDGREVGRQENQAYVQSRLEDCYARKFTIGQCVMENGWPIKAPPAPEGERSNAAVPVDACDEEFQEELEKRLNALEPR